jgi:hypothetical protein
MRLPTPGSVEHLIVFPRSGFINRFQTLASSSILAKQLGVPLSICWLPCPFVSGPASETFSAEFCSEYVISEDEAQQRFSVSLDAVPRYVSFDAAGNWVGLRGHDRGEQALLKECVSSLADHAPVRLVVVAGGSFFVPDEELIPAGALTRFKELKRDFYRGLSLHPAVEAAVSAQESSDPSPYLGLHLRYTDRSHQAPFPRDIRRALLKASSDTGLSRLFIASDSGAARRHWHEEARALGLDPWSYSPGEGGVSGPHAALIDWRLLGSAQRLVYFSESSYSAEAAVASGTWENSIGLGPHPVRSAAVRTRSYAQAGLRRLRGSRSTG